MWVATAFTGCDREWEGCGGHSGLRSGKQVLPLPADLSLSLWQLDSAVCRWLFGSVPHELKVEEREKGSSG